MVGIEDKRLALREAVRWNYSAQQLTEVVRVLIMVVSPEMSEDTFHSFVQTINVLDAVIGEVDAQIDAQIREENKTLESFRGF